MNVVPSFDRLDRILALCLLTGISLSFVALAEASPPPNNLLNSPSFGSLETQSTPVIRSYGDKVVSVWTDVRVGGTAENKFHYAVSVDSGATFNDVGTLPPIVNAGVTYLWRNNPQLAIDPSNGKVFIAGVGFSQNGSNQQALAIVSGTFSGPSLIWSTPIFIRLVSGTTDVGSVSMTAGPAAGSLHILMAENGVARYQRSIDGNGVTWAAPVDLSSAGDLGTVAFPKLVPSAANILYAAWCAGVTIASQPIRFRASSDNGSNWDFQITAGTMRINPEMPGQAQVLLSDRRYGFSMAVNRIVDSNRFGRIAIAWAETWDFADEPFPALTGVVIRNEVEPNDTSTTANGFAIGNALFGTKSSATDRDYWKVVLAAGDPVLIWGDSTDASSRISILDTNGTSVLINGLAGSAAARAFAFRAPYAGTFYFRMDASFPGSFLRVRTRFGTPQPSDAQDSRDVTVVYRDPFLFPTFSSPQHWNLGPVGYDDHLPTIGFGADGLDYVSWYDLSRVPGEHSKSHLVVARNLVGADPSPMFPEVVTTEPTDWGSISVFIPPAMGITNDVWTDPRRLHLAWTDGRDHNPDAYAARLATTAAITSCPSDTSVGPNGVAYLRIGVLNRNVLFQEKDVIARSGNRSWPCCSSEDLVGAGTTGYLIVPIAVPDTAAPGVNHISLAVTRQGGMPLGTCQCNLTVTPATGVGDLSASGFEVRSIAPNPARGPVQVDFTLPSRSPVRIEVYGIQGNRVRSLVDSERAAGAQRVTWDGRDDRGMPAPSGLYLVKVQALGKAITRPAMIIR